MARTPPSYSQLWTNLHSLWCKLKQPGRLEEATCILQNPLERMRHAGRRLVPRRSPCNHLICSLNGLASSRALPQWFRFRTRTLDTDHALGAFLPKQVSRDARFQLCRHDGSPEVYTTCFNAEQCTGLPSM